MRAKQSILGLVYTGGEVRRPPLVGMQFLHERAVRTPDFVRAPPPAAGQGSGRPPRPSFYRRRRAASAPCRVSLRVLTPGGKPAVQIAFE